MSERRWWETRWFALAAVLLGALPLLWPAVPPLVDLPGHLGRYHVAASLATSPELQRHWTYQWRWIGNLGVDLAVLPLVPLLGVELATKLVVLAIPALTIAGLILVSREGGGGRLAPAAPFAFPLAYGFPFQFGFVNFALSAALALLALALWMRLARDGRLRLRALLFVPIALLLWTAHCFGWAMFGLFAFGSELATLRAAGVIWTRAILRAGLRCLLLTGPVIPMLAGGASGDGHLNASWEWRAKIGWLASLLREQWPTYDFLAVLVLALLCWAGLRSALLRVDRPLAWAAAVGALAWLLLPYRLLGGAYVDMRMAPYVVALLIVAIRPRAARHGAALATAATAFFLLRVTTTTWVFVGAAAAQEQAAAVETALPRGAAVLVAVRTSCIEWSAQRLAHVAGFALARRDVFDNSEWTLAGQQLLRDRHPHAGVYRADPSQLIYDPSCALSPAGLPRMLRDFDRGTFDHVWILGFRPTHLPADLIEVARSGPSILYRVRRPADKRLP
ncbi:hypothetical protein [Sphingomonas sp. TDK1]|uniref:hypothetical protein n=1 Tax=Sphingomonas sp. TDK1 TaxID=453247 RepID=UPI0009FF8E29|nr:hypothetical protein [Sphingomonas sp. TDK1]